MLGKLPDDIYDHSFHYIKKQNNVKRARNPFLDDPLTYDPFPHKVDSCDEEDDEELIIQRG